MRLALATAVVLLAAAMPAHATGGMECRTGTGRGPIVAFGFPHGIAPQVFSASIQDGPLTLRTGGLIEAGRLRSLAVGQSWIDRELVMLDLVDAQVTRFEGQLRARFTRRGEAAVGTFVRNGRTWRVRCVES